MEKRGKFDYILLETTGILDIVLAQVNKKCQISCFEVSK
jgi:hypothetical protein